MSDTTYTQDELDEFRNLVEKTESRINATRVVGRIELREFVKTHGKEKCDAMFEILKKEIQ